MPQQRRDPEIKKHDGLEIEESPRAQQRLWKLQKYFRRLAIIILFLTLLGVFGKGPLSHGHEQNDQIIAKFERIPSYGTEQELRLTFTIHKSTQKFLRFWIDQETFELIKIKNFQPKPSDNYLSQQGVIFEFPVDENLQQLKILIDFEAEKIGTWSMRLGLVDGKDLRLKQFYIP